jgi:hypothetical protein
MEVSQKEKNMQNFKGVLACVLAIPAYAGEIRPDPEFEEALDKVVGETLHKDVPSVETLTAPIPENLEGEDNSSLQGSAGQKLVGVHGPLSPSGDAFIPVDPSLDLDDSHQETSHQYKLQGPNEGSPGISYGGGLNQALLQVNSSNMADSGALKSAEKSQKNKKHPRKKPVEKKKSVQP